MGYYSARLVYISQENPLHKLSYSLLHKDIQKQKVIIKQIEDYSDQQIGALTLQLSDLNARLLRLDALGERVSEIAQLPRDEFEFQRSPALGGPTDKDLGVAYEMPSLSSAIVKLNLEVEKRESKLRVLEALLDGRKLYGDAFVAGRPIERGWMSSVYGRRTDPFTGRLAWHKGVDFAGKENSKVLAVASGVVVWSGKKSGYGNLVEINHGGGFVTRYGHNSKHLVKVGEVVNKGQAIALMGSTGRSTGPHVHFEVIKNGKHVNPEHYVRRANKPAATKGT